MKESDIEAYFCWVVEVRLKGKTWKFASPNHRGVADRIACLPDGSTWFVELKKPGGKLSAHQIQFGEDMKKLDQNYAVLWSAGQVDEWQRSL